MNKWITPFRVGLLLLISGAFLFAAVTFVRKGGLSASDSLQVFAYFRDASGLGQKSRVQIAGVPVGQVDRIELVDGRAKIFLKIRKDVNLRANASLRKRSESLLGDYMLDLYPGSSAAPPLSNGDEIRIVLDQQGMEAAFEALSKIAGDVEQVTSSFRQTLGGEKGAASLQKIVDNLVHLSTTADGTLTNSSAKLNEILSNFAVVSQQVRSLTTHNQQNVQEVVENVRQITEDAQQVMATLRSMIDGAGPEGTSGGAKARAGFEGLKQTLDHLDKTLANLEEVSSNIKQGKGAVGALVSDERLGQKLGEAVEDVSDFASRLTRLQVELNLKSEYLFSQGAAKNTLGIRIIPKPDKYYLLDVVDDPRGVVDRQIVETNPPATGQPQVQVQRITHDAFKFSAQFAKRFSFVTFRFGLIESTGGVGSDLYFLNDALSLRVDAFNFSVAHLTYPRLRAALRFQAFNHLFVSGGMDDIFNRQSRDPFTHELVTGRDFFLGGGVYFTDDDLKAILPILPRVP